MYHARIAIALSLAALLLPGCASMLNKGKATMTIDSDPSGATIAVNGQERGTTPFTYTYVPGDGSEVSFELRKSGFRSATLSLQPERANGVLFADAMLFQIPYAVDGKSPDLYRLPVGTHTVVLHKETPQDQTRYMMPVTRGEIAFGDREPLGTLGSKPLRTIKGGIVRELQYPENLVRAAVQGLEGTWMDAQMARPGSEKGAEAIRRAKMHLTVKLNGVRARFTGDEGRCSGPLELDLEWSIHSGTGSDSVLHTVNRTVVYHAFQDRLSDVLARGVALGATRLAEEEELPALAAGLFSSGLQASKGTVLALKRPVPIAYNGRKEMLSALVKAVVTITTDDGHGSGFLISNDGYLITNQHVVEDQALVKVKFEQGFTLDAQVQKTNEDFDLALLKVSATDLPALTIGDDKGLMLGEELFAIGTPLDATLGQSVSRGILSGRREYHEHQYIQTDVSINPGNSGGPVVDETGRVVGVATMKISGDGLEGLGFAVPISVAIEMLNITFE